MWLEGLGGSQRGLALKGGRNGAYVAETSEARVGAKHGLTLASVSHCHGGVSHANQSVMTLFPQGDLGFHSSSTIHLIFFLFTSK